MSYSIFNQAGENIESKLFDTAEEAQVFMNATDYVTEYGPVHVGINCKEHDELEAGTCQHCKKKNHYTLQVTDEKGEDRYYTGRGFSRNPDLAISSLSLDSAGLYLAWGQRDHPTWTDWKIRITS